MNEIPTSQLTLLNLETPTLEAKVLGDSSSGLNLLSLPLRLSRRLAGADVTIREAVAHETVFRCLEKITDAAQDAQPTVERKGRADWSPDLTHPLLTRLKSPNLEQGWPEFFKQLLIDEHAWGRWYVEIVRSRSLGVAELRPIDVRWVIEVGEYGMGGYLYDLWNDELNIGRVISYVVDDGIRQREILPKNLVAFRLFPRNSVMGGLSPVRAALASVGVDASLNRYADAYLTNGGPSGLLKVKGKRLTDVQAEALQARWRAKYAQGGTNEGGVAVLDEDADYQAIGSPLEDLAADELKQHVEAAICSAMGVPPVLVGAFVGLRWNNQRAGAVMALRDFWANKMSPLMARYRHLFNRYFLSLYEDPALIETRVRCGWDLSQSAAANEDVDLIAKRARDNFNSGLVSVNEAREKLGYAERTGGDLLKGEGQEEDPRQPQDDDEKKLGKKGALPTLKVYEWNGLRLGRKPTPEEEKALFSVASAQDSARARAVKVLGLIRVELIKDGLELLTPDAPPKLDLSPAQLAQVKAVVEDAYRTGQATVSDPAKAETKGPIFDAVKRIAKAAARAISAAISGRLFEEFNRRILRGADEEQARTETEKVIEKESVSYLEAIATGIAYQAVGEGRNEQLQNAAGPGDRFIYSAILDANTCEICEEADLTESTNPEDLPETPNPDCEGRWRCRCMIVIAHASEGE